MNGSNDSYPNNSTLERHAQFTLVWFPDTSLRPPESTLRAQSYTPLFLLSPRCSLILGFLNPRRPYRCRLLQVLSELLNFLTTEERIAGLLSTMTPNCTKTGTLRVARVTLNERAQPGGALHERLLDTMVGHVAELGGKVR